MDINEIKRHNGGLYSFQTENFATVKIKYFFAFENTKENFVKAKLLSLYLKKTNEKYRTIKEIRNKCKELYGLNFTVDQSAIGTKTFLSYSITFPSPRVVEEDYFKEAIEFFSTMMLNPYFDGGSLDEKVFEETKKDIVNFERNEVSNPAKMQKRLFLKYVMPDSDMNNHNITDIDELVQIIESTDDKDIIDFYRNTMKNYVLSYAFGNLTDDEIEALANRFDFESIELDTNYSFKEEITKDYKEVISEYTTQSVLYVLYDIHDYKRENKYLYRTIEYMLNSISGLCMNILRTKLGIVYGASGQFYNNRGLMVICAKIDKKNKDIALKGIDEIIETLKDKKEVDRLLDYSKEKQHQLLYTETESLNANICELENFCFKKDMPRHKSVELVDKLTSEDIIRQINNLEKKYIFFYIGDKDEK